MAQRLPPQVRRERILDTAVEMVAQQGYRGLTMKAVAERCGLTAPAVTYYFKDMQALLIAVLRRRDALDGDRFVPTGPHGTLTADAKGDVLAPEGCQLHGRTTRSARKLHALKLQQGPSWTSVVAAWQCGAFR